MDGVVRCAGAARYPPAPPPPVCSTRDGRAGEQTKNINYGRKYGRENPRKSIMEPCQIKTYMTSSRI